MHPMIRTHSRTRLLSVSDQNPLLGILLLLLFLGISNRESQPQSGTELITHMPELSTSTITHMPGRIRGVVATTVSVFDFVPSANLCLKLFELVTPVFELEIARAVFFSGDWEVAFWLPNSVDGLVQGLGLGGECGFLRHLGVRLVMDSLSLMMLSRAVVAAFSVQ